MYAAHLVFPFRRVSRHPLMWQARRGGGYSLIFKSLNELRAPVHRGEGENPPSSVFARRHAAAARSYLNLYLVTTSLVLPFRSGRVRSASGAVRIRRPPVVPRRPGRTTAPTFSQCVASHTTETQTHSPITHCHRTQHERAHKTGYGSGALHGRSAPAARGSIPDAPTLWPLTCP